VTVTIEIPDVLRGRGIHPPYAPRAFAVDVTHAEPRAGGVVEGRVVSKAGRRDPRPITVRLVCTAAWLDVAPQSVGQRNLRSLSTAYDLRARRVPVWFDEPVGETVVVVGALDTVNWLAFRFVVPDGWPAATEATFAAFRYELMASRRRWIGHTVASAPIVMTGERSEPVVRIEKTPLGSWRLFEWRAPDEQDAASGNVAIRYEPRRLGDQPLPGETREQEVARRTGRIAGPA
jgi:hypothetical protein